MKKIHFGFLYELCLGALVILSLTLDLPPSQSAIFDWFIWATFFLDYLVRIIKSDHKWKYFKDHPLDFIAILPLDQIFRTARFVRIFRILRLVMIMNRRTLFIDQLLRKYKLDTLVVSVMAILFIVSLPMKWIEPSFDSYGDSLWWAIVTMTTVGYGDLSPETTVGRIIASVLMLAGIGIIGLITGTVASIFTNKKEDNLPKELNDIKQRINEYPNIDKIDYIYMIKKLEKLKDELD